MKLNSDTFFQSVGQGNSAFKNIGQSGITLPGVALGVAGVAAAGATAFGIKKMVQKPGIDPKLLKKTVKQAIKETRPGLGGL